MLQVRGASQFAGTSQGEDLDGRKVLVDEQKEIYMKYGEMGRDGRFCWQEKFTESRRIRETSISYMGRSIHC